MLFLKFHVRPPFDPIFFTTDVYSVLRWFSVCQKFVDREVGNRIIVQKWQLLAISEKWTSVLACCSCKLIINNECLVYVYSLEFPLIIYLTEIGHFHTSYLISNRADFAVRGPSSLHISISQAFSYLVDTMSLSLFEGVSLMLISFLILEF